MPDIAHVCVCAFVDIFIAKGRLMHKCVCVRVW